MNTTPRCPTCDHNVSGVTSMVCPECGSEFVWLPAGSKAPLPKNKRKQLLYIALTMLIGTSAGSIGLTFLQFRGQFGNIVDMSEVVGAVLMTSFFAVIFSVLSFPVLAGLIVFVSLSVSAACGDRKKVKLAIISFVCVSLYLLTLAGLAAAAAANFD